MGIKYEQSLLFTSKLISRMDEWVDLHTQLKQMAPEETLAEDEDWLLSNDISKNSQSRERTPLYNAQMKVSGLMCFSALGVVYKNLFSQPRSIAIPIPWSVPRVNGKIPRYPYLGRLRIPPSVTLTTDKKSASSLGSRANSFSKSPVNDDVSMSPPLFPAHNKNTGNNESVIRSLKLLQHEEQSTTEYAKEVAISANQTLAMTEAIGREIETLARICSI